MPSACSIREWGEYERWYVWGVFSCRSERTRSDKASRKRDGVLRAVPITPAQVLPGERMFTLGDSTMKVRSIESTTDAACREVIQLQLSAQRTRGSERLGLGSSDDARRLFRRLSFAA